MQQRTSTSSKRMFEDPSSESDSGKATATTLGKWKDIAGARASGCLLSGSSGSLPRTSASREQALSTMARVRAMLRVLFPDPVKKSSFRSRDRSLPVKQLCLILAFTSGRSRILGKCGRRGSAALATVSESKSSSVEGTGTPTSFMRPSHSARYTRSSAMSAGSGSASSYLCGPK